MALHFSQQFDLDTSPHAEALDAARRQVGEAAAREELGFLKLPHADITEIETLARELREEFKAVVVIGIGGSDLGSRAVHRALHSQYYNMDEKSRHGCPQLFFAGDTTDPVALSELIEQLEWQTTALIMISKSGNTVEQMSTFVFLREKLLEKVLPERVNRHIITVTDAVKGTLRDLTNQEGYRNLSVPADVGGRFSVLSVVGLLPLAIVGIDIRALLAGAAEITLENAQPADYALLQYQAYSERKQRYHVIMPYTYSLREVGFWFRQLWAESLGKQVDLAGNEVHTSPTPIASVGPTDQHSQVQLYREGLNDKTYTFITVKNPVIDYTLPHVFPHFDGIAYLGGHTFNEIVLAEQQSTEQALREVGRPTCHIQLDVLDANHLGQLIMFLELATAYAGALFGIDTYNQPGVERGKEIMYHLLGRPGHS